MCNAIVESPVIREMLAGNTRDDNGVPLGLVNYMVHNRLPTQRHVRIGTRIGVLHFVLALGGIGMNLNIWNDFND